MSESNRRLADLTQREQKALNIPNDMKFYSAFPFSGMNQEDARTAIADQEFFWLENFLLVGRAGLRTIWDKGTALYTATGGKKIVYFSWFNIGTAQYVAIFLSDGTAVQVAQSNGAVTTITSTFSTFYRGGQLPFGVQSGEQYLLIGNNNTSNDYWIWDGAVLYGAGAVGPYQIGQLTSAGAGYTSTPSYTVFGGSGSGVTLTPAIANGSVVSYQITNAGTGYLPNDVVQVAFSGGGGDTAAVLIASLAASTIEAITLLAGGTGYTNGVHALAFSGGGGGSGAAGVFTVAGGIVVSIGLTANGSGYTSTPTVSFASGGGGARRRLP